MCIQESKVLMQFKVKFLYGSFLKWPGFEENHPEVITHTAALVKSKQRKHQWLNHYEYIILFQYSETNMLCLSIPSDFSLLSRLHPKAPFPNFCYYLCFVFPFFFPHFFPILIFLAFGISGAYFSSTPREGIVSLPLSQSDQSCPVFCNLLILLSYLSLIIFLHFNYLHVLQTTEGACN